MSASALEALSPQEWDRVAEAHKTPDALAAFMTRGRQQRPKHLQHLGRVLAEGILRGNARIAVTMPPRHGKSELCSWWLPVWFLTLFPFLRVIMAGYGGGFAQEWGRRVRNTVESEFPPGWLDWRVAEDSSAADRWHTTRGGGMYAVGVGGPLTGRGADLLIIDDPIKSDAEAQSEVFRENVWRWWQQTALTRLEPGGSVIIVHTRWHEDDLLGRLIRAEPGAWTVVNFPAIAESVDEIGRQPGDALWPERYDVEALKVIREGKGGAGGVGSYAWNALYQQRPAPLEGGLLKRAWFKRRWRPSPHAGYIESDGQIYELAGMRRFQIVDVAASLKQQADYTVIATWGIAPRNPSLAFLLGVRRARMEGPDIEPAIRAEMAKWKPHFIGVESVAFQLALVQQLRRGGLPVREIEVDKDKVSRALSVTPYCEAGRIILPAEASWLGDLEAEWYTFPNAAHDDTVDILSPLSKYFGTTGGFDPGPMLARPSSPLTDLLPPKNPLDDLLSGNSGSPI